MESHIGKRSRIFFSRWKGTTKLEIIHGGGDTTFEVVGYSDSDYADDFDGRRPAASVLLLGCVDS